MNNSECCDAPLLNFNDGLGLCSDCKEWAGPHKDDEMETDNVNDKYMEIISTFWVNTASVKFRPTLMALIRAETHSKPRRETFTPKTYEDRAAEYYARHGTVGEF